jgi:hypothetical protein
MSQRRSNFRFDLSGGNLALDFANTVSYRPTENRKERLGEYRDLVALIANGHAARASPWPLCSAGGAEHNQNGCKMRPAAEALSKFSRQWRSIGPFRRCPGAAE